MVAFTKKKVLLPHCEQCLIFFAGYGNHPNVLPKVASPFIINTSTLNYSLRLDNSELIIRKIQESYLSSLRGLLGMSWSSSRLTSGIHHPSLSNNGPVYYHQVHTCSQAKSPADSVTVRHKFRHPTDLDSYAEFTRRSIRQ